MEDAVLGSTENGNLNGIGSERWKYFRLEYQVVALNDKTGRNWVKSINEAWMC